jgi:hypothetical protein
VTRLNVLCKGGNVKEKMIFGLLALFLVAMGGAPALYAEGDDSIISEEGRASAPEAGSSGAVEEVFTQDDTGESDPSAFEGDSENMPGERAPENMPMDDAPVDVGMGVGI